MRGVGGGQGPHSAPPPFLLLPLHPHSKLRRSTGRRGLVKSQLAGCMQVPVSVSLGWDTRLAFLASSYGSIGADGPLWEPQQGGGDGPLCPRVQDL